VLDKAVAAAASWSAAGFDLSVAVNLAVRSLLDPRIVATVEAVLDRHHLPASRLTLEITEDSVMTDPERAIAVLNALRALGVRLSVDDFGTGYSSLTYLQRLPVDEVKIDRSFVSSVDHDTNDLLITRSIIDLGANLSLEVIAEGVEDQATWDRLATLGCHGIQGDHLAPPLPADVMLIWLRGYTTRAGTNRLGTPPGATTGTDVSPPRPRSPRRTADAPRSVDARGAGPGRPRR
jgi:EAL domain-containing protein (putative c-di-GMP-specific phosphodiesterase class I)